MNRELGKLSIFVICVWLLSGCSAGLKVGATETPATTAARSAQVSLTLDTIQSQIQKNWKIDSDGRAWVSKTKVSLTGTCVRGVKKVEFIQSGALLGSAVCSTDGTYQWAYEFSKDGPVDLTLSASWNQSSIKDQMPLVQKLMLKSTAPLKPVFTTNQGKDFSVQTSKVDLDGLASSDTVSLLSQGASGLLRTTKDFSQFTYSIDLKPGEVKTVTLVAVDFVGNQSEPVSIQVAYDASVRLASAEFVSHADGSSVQSLDQQVVKTVSQVSPVLQLTSQGYPTESLYVGAPAIRSLYE